MEILEDKIDLEGPTPLVDQVYLGCSQRSSEVNEELIASKADFLKRITTSRVKDEDVPADGNVKQAKIQN